MLVGAGGKVDPVYIDDIFKTYLWKGNGSDNRAVTTGIDLSTKEGMVWLKNRNTTYNHTLFDTIRGAEKRLFSNSDSVQLDDSTSLKSFTSTGFTLGTGNNVNGTSHPDFASWNFRSQKGFFDVVTYTGTGGATQSVAHNLGSVPGCIMVKRLTGGSESWAVYHKNMSDGTTDAPGEKICELNSDDARKSSTSYFTATLPTATHFYVGSNNGTGASSEDYVAYLFAGGESTAATARSVDFNGGNNIASNTDNDFNFGTGDYCIECWMKLDDISAKHTAWTLGDTATAGGMSLTAAYSTIRVNDGRENDIILTRDLGRSGVWTHVAVTRESGTSRLFIDGNLEDTATEQNGQTIGSGTNNNKITIGTQIENGSAGDHMDGYISNFRIVKGSAVYTSSFTPSTEPLTNITNTVLLCCNNSSITGSTVTPTTLNDNGGTASTDSPFDDPAGYVFGETKDQNIIECSIYRGNGSNTGPLIDLTWEPQWLMFKNISSGSNPWLLIDSMRGMDSNNQKDLKLNADEAENTNEWLNVSPRGFQLKTTSSYVNTSNDYYIYVAIRRPDGLVSKPLTAGTQVLAIDTGAGSSTIPNYDSGFPVDFAFHRQVNATSSWNTSARFWQKKKILLDTTDDEADDNNNVYDSNVGWSINNGANSDFVSWMWKRHAGFEVQHFSHNVNNTNIRWHNMGRAPEMIWLKRTNVDSTNWYVYHKFMNGGTDSNDYMMFLNSDVDQESQTDVWGDTTQISNLDKYFTMRPGTWGTAQYIMAMFASIPGFSKCGYYTGSNNTTTVTTGFQPRLVIIKSYTGDEWWQIADTTRGWGSGNDKLLRFDGNDEQRTWMDLGAPTSTGFTLTGGDGVWNAQGYSYLYYAHA